MKNPSEVIKSQIISEKGTYLAETANQYLFRVAPDANKVEVKAAVEQLYQVKVTEVQILNRPGKEVRRGLKIGHVPGYRRAIVRLAAGNSISLT